MKIAFLTFSLQGGGAERMVSRLANAFVARGHQVDILLFYTENQAYSIDSAIRIINAGKNSKNKIKRILEHIKAIRLYLKENKPDVLFSFIVTMLPFAVLGRIWSKCNCKIIGAERANPKFIKCFYRFVVRLFLPFCNGFIFQTDGARKCYPKRIQKISAVIGNIAPSIDVNRNLAEIKKNAVCSVGRLHSDKDYDTLIIAFSQVIKKIPDATLHIFGQGPLEENYKKMVTEMGCSKNIIFEGFTNRIDLELPKYEIFAFSSKAEGMPNALIEAMCYGCACVSSDCDFGPREIIEDGKNGFLVPVGDTKLLSQRLIQLLEDQNLRNEFSQESKRVQDKYSEDKIVNAYLKYAEDICRNKLLF